MFKLVALMSVASFGLAMVATGHAADAKSPLEFKMKDIGGKEVDLSKYKGKVILFVNVASKCGLTGQYAGLEELYKKYGEQGLVILGFPANEFGRQEPGTDAEISTFCKTNYGVTFDMFSKIVVKGDEIHPLYQFLTAKETNPKFAGPISWNFEKFLVGKDGQVVNRFSPRTTPQASELVTAIETELKK